MRRNYFKFIGGILLTAFNILVLIFAQDKIFPSYFEGLFAFYFLIGFIFGIKLMWDGSQSRRTE